MTRIRSSPSRHSPHSHSPAGERWLMPTRDAHSATIAALAAARAAGLEVRADGGRLVVRGPTTAEALVRPLVSQPGAVLALLAAEDADVAWRVAAMRPQVPRRGAI